MNRFNTLWEKAKSAVSSNSQEVVELGWEQHVILDHQQKLVYRFPRNEKALAKLSDEVLILNELNKQKWNVAIPKLLEFNGKRAKYELIEGVVLDPKMINTLKSDQFSQIGSGLGKFLAKLHSLPVGVAKHKAWKQKQTLLEYYRDRIEGSRDSVRWKASAKQALDKLIARAGSHDESVPVHGDLHGLNIIIEPENKKLVGVIDFSEIEIGDSHQDFRKIFMIDERLLSPAIKSYSDARNVRVSEELVKSWAFVNEWANLCFFDGEPKNATYRRALAHLKRWHQI